MNNMPLVSVIMPAYNSRLYITEAIHSVLDQDYGALELIVVDDGSTDGTPDEARLFGDRVRVIEQKNGGPAAARNRGVSVANGELLAFIDSDDVWLPGKVRAQVNYLKDNPDVGVVFGRWVRWTANADGSFGSPPEFFEATSAQLIIPEMSGWIYPELLIDSVIWIVSAMVRKSIWETLGGLDESLRVGEEYDFFLRASRLCRTDKLDKVVAYYRIHNESTTHVMRTVDFECLVLMRTLDRFGTNGPDGRGLSQQLLRERQFKLFFNHGYQHYRNGSPHVAVKAFQQAISIYPSASWKVWAYLVLSSIKCLGSLDKSSL